MGAIDTIRARHSVREYLDRPIEGDMLESLRAEVDDAARESGLDIQLVLDNPEVFQVVGRIGLIKGATASVVFVAEGREDDEAIGYWGQRIVLKAQELGLNTCWVALCAKKKSHARVPADKSVRIVVAVGYGTTAGSARRSKTAEQVTQVACEREPAWFATAVEAALLAPTAVNRQNFTIALEADGRTVHISSPGTGLTTIDRGIVKRNFEKAARELEADFVLL